MKIEIGESLFYSWLRHVKECQIAQNNWKSSLQWTLMNADELSAIKDKTDDFFYNKYGYRIYKNNSSLDQIIQQGESDAVGISFNGGEIKTYAVDVAFHVDGLRYGSKDVTIMKIINKCIRTAMCLYGYMNVTNAEIIFASPKIHRNILSIASVCIEELQQLMFDMGYKFVFRIISNAEFKEKVLKPVLLTCENIEDTTELFVRSYKMIQMFKEEDSTNTTQNNRDSIMNTESGNELKIGKLAQIMIPKLIQEGKVSEEEIQKMLTLPYSKQTFGLQFPVLAKVDSKYEKCRYYKNTFKANPKEEYALCSQWYEIAANNDRPYLEKWIKEHE